MPARLTEIGGVLSSSSVSEGPGRFPPLDNLRKVWVSFRRHEAEGEDLGQAFAAAQAAFAEMESHLRIELQLRPLTQQALDLVPIVLTHYDRVNRLFAALAETLETANWDGAERKLERLSKALDRLYIQLDRLADLEKERPELSPSPYVDQLLHTAYGVLEERLPPTSLQIRAAALLEHYDRLMEQLEPRLESMTTESSSAEVEELLEAVELATEGLEVLTHENLDTQTILSAMEDVRVAGESIDKVRLELQKQDEPRPLACPRCGNTYEAGDRHCGSCNAVLPTVAAQSGPTSSFQVQVGNPSSEGPRRIQVANLLQVLDQVLSQQAGPGELLAAIIRFEKKLQAGQAELQRTPPAPDEAPAEHKEAVARTAEEIEKGLEGFAQGLAALRDFVDSAEPRYAEVGRATILEAEASLDTILCQGEQALKQNRSG